MRYECVKKDLNISPAITKFSLIKNNHIIFVFKKYDYYIVISEHFCGVILHHDTTAASEQIIIRGLFRNFTHTPLIGSALELASGVVIGVANGVTSGVK